MAAKDPVGRLADYAKKLGITTEFLEETVVSTAQNWAEFVNEENVAAQINFLISSGWSVDDVKEELDTFLETLEDEDEDEE